MGILFVIAGFICFVLAGLGVGVPRVHLGWIGAACLTLGAFIIGHVHL